ncbi:MAG: murein biosynthesis integral membrane protein MurJ [Bdellovibrionales bacterium]|nr:murein biosynthesis integral membrane protein MurJ [Bdellovibrionales bacterium]
MAEKDPPDLQHADLQHASKKVRKELKKQSVIRSALAMAAGTFSSRILGFVRDAVMLHMFPRAVTDCFVVAFRLPNMFRRLFGEGSLSVSFIPIFVEARADSEERARRLSNAVFSIVTAISVVLSVACFVWMDKIIGFLVGDPRGFAANPEKVVQTIYLARIMIFYLWLVSVYAFHMAIANTLGYFFIPAAGATLFNFGLIVFTVLPFELGAYAGSSQAWGVIAGGVLQAGIVAWLLIQQGVLPRFTLQWRDPDVARVFRNMLPGLFGLGVFQVMTVVSTKFAARLSEGAQTYIYAADRILELPQSLIAVSLGAALLPRFSELHTSGEKHKFLDEANQAVRMLLYLSLPAAVGMYFLAIPITQVLFMRGAFTQADAEGTASVVGIYAVLLLFSSLSRVTAPAFYALKNTWLPAAVALFVLALYISLGPYLVEHYGLEGLAAATSASAILNIIILQVCFRFWIGPLGYGRIFISVLRMIPGLVGLGAFCYYGYPALLDLVTPHVSLYPARTLTLSLVISGGMVIYFGLTMLTGSEAGHKVFAMLKRRRVN